MFPTFLIILIALLVVLLLYGLVVKWIVAPILVRAKYRITSKPAFAAVSPEQLTPEMRDFIATVLRQLLNEGFETVANVALGGAVSDVKGVTVLLVNRSTSDLATLNTSHAGSLRSLVSVVRSDFADGKSIVTAHNRDIGMYPQNPDIDALVVSWERDVTALAEAHRRRVERAGRSADVRVAPPPGGEIAYLEAEWERENRRYVRCGYHYVDPETGDYRQTWKGAFLCAWKLTEPVKSWRIRRRYRRARRAWTALGMDDWSPPAPQPPPAPVHVRTSSAVVAHEAYGDLDYQAPVAAGKVRADWAGDILTVRIGAHGRWATLASHWPTLISLLVFGFMVGFMLWMNWWLQYRMTAILGPAVVGRRPTLSVWFYVLLIILFLDVFKLTRALIFARGDVVLTASRQGLTYHNAPAWTSTGSMARDDIESIRVRHVAGIFRKEFRVEARLRGSGRWLPLFAGTDCEAMECVRRDLALAMGIDAPPPASEVLTPSSEVPVAEP